MGLCKCGCGEETSKRAIWRKGHSRRGVKFSKEHRQKISEGQKKNSYFHKYNKTEEHRQKVIQSNKNREVTEETKQKIAGSLTGFNHSEETKLKMKITHTDRDSDKEKNNYWRGGTSGYGYGWLKISKEIKKRDEYKCRECSSENNIDVHHIDLDPLNNEPLNLITLCRRCHINYHLPKGFMKRYRIKRIRKRSSG